MTQLLDTEIKLLKIQFKMMFIIGFFWLLYALQPMESSYNIPTTATNGSSVDTSGSFITSLSGSIIPTGMGELAAVTALIMSPFLTMDLLIGLRFAKDIATNWL